LFLPVVLSALGNVYLQRGQAAKARDILLEAREEADALGNSSSTLLASTYLASAHALLGDTSKGLEAARACQAGAKQKGYLGVEALAIFAEALILSLQGDAADAIARYERMIEIAEDLEAWPLQGLAKGALARLFAAAGRKSEAKDELEQAVELFARSKMTNQLERAKAVLSKFSDL
jgi:ATP/maltotriose-dependent transcriptional regulator MalT